ncbi:MAG TPA: LysR family transcriptional regulator [Rhizobiales bacterium]|nr:LysR family transcriptional regulator [Hyphomicrobiales bacterium]
MDWDKLRVFHAVAKAGSFTHAGHALGLSQSAVSRQISSLESDLKVHLFHRHARGLILTEQGEILYQTVRDVFSRLAATKARITDAREKPAGDLRITTTVGLGSIWLTPRLRPFIEMYPDINVSLMLQDRELDLSMREAEVAIRLRQPSQPDLIQRRLFTVHQNVYASPEYLREHGVPKDLSDLDDHVLLSYGETVPPYLSDVNWLQKAGRPAGSPRPVALRINNVYGIRRALETGLGIATLPDYIVGEDTNLIRIELTAATPAFNTYFVYPEELRNSKRVAVFRDFIVARAREWKF